LQILLAYNMIEKVRELFIEYQTTMNLDLRFQNFDAELANLPGDYALPGGRLYIAMHGDHLAGCIALRAIDNQNCEMKRLFVRGQFRGLGAGRALSERIIKDAQEIGYSRMVLDTFASMKEAILLYKKLGFVEIEPYNNNPNTDAVFLGLDLLKVM